MSIARGGLVFVRAGACALVGFEVWGILGGHSASSATTLVTALVLGALAVVLCELARRSASASVLWVPSVLCGPLAILVMNSEAPERGVAGQIGLVYAVVFGGLYLRPAAAWLVTGLTVLADLGINVGMFDAELALYNTATVGLALVIITFLMASAVRQQEETAADLTEQATIDALTSLVTRRELERAAARVLGSGQPRARDRHRDLGVALLVIDLDHFKALNDTYGHPAGDRALVHVAGLVRRCAGSSATVARLGGDELAVLLAERTRESAGRIAQCIVDCIGSLPLENGDDTLRLSASVGVSHVPGGVSATPAELYAEADEALYRAKLDGRSRFAFSS